MTEKKRHGFTCNGVRWEVFADSSLGEGMINTPTDPQEVIGSYVGLIPTFFTIELLDSANMDSIIDAVEGAYGFPCSALEGGTVNASGVYQYPNEGDLNPVAKTLIGAATVYIYLYGITAIAINDQQVIIRLD